MIYNNFNYISNNNEATKYYIRNNLSSIDKIQVTGVDNINNGNITSFQELDYSKISNAYLNVYNNSDHKKNNALNTYYNDPIFKYKVNKYIKDTYEGAQKVALASLYENIIPTYSFNPVDSSTSSNIVINPMNYYDVKYLKAQVWDNMILDIFSSQKNYGKDYGNWKYKIGIKEKEGEPSFFYYKFCISC